MEFTVFTDFLNRGDYFHFNLSVPEDGTLEEIIKGFTHAIYTGDYYEEFSMEGSWTRDGAVCKLDEYRVTLKNDKSAEWDFFRRFLREISKSPFIQFALFPEPKDTKVGSMWISHVQNEPTSDETDWSRACRRGLKGHKMDDPARFYETRRYDALTTLRSHVGSISKRKIYTRTENVVRRAFGTPSPIKLVQQSKSSQVETGILILMKLVDMKTTLLPLAGEEDCEFEYTIDDYVCPLKEKHKEKPLPFAFSQLCVDMVISKACQCYMCGAIDGKNCSCDLGILTDKYDDQMAQIGQLIGIIPYPEEDVIPFVLGFWDVRKYLTRKGNFYQEADVINQLVSSRGTVLAKAKAVMTWSEFESRRDATTTNIKSAMKIAKHGGLLCNLFDGGYDLCCERDKWGFLQDVDVQC